MATPEEMELVAPDAENDLTDIIENFNDRIEQEEALRLIANWWAKWVGKVGHKRLGRILLQYKKEE